MAVAYQQRMNEMQQDVDRAGMSYWQWLVFMWTERETSELLEAAELLEKETQAYMEEKKTMTEDFERQKAELREAMGWLKSENDSIFQTCLFYLCNSYLQLCALYEMWFPYTHLILLLHHLFFLFYWFMYSCLWQLQWPCVY